jgi:hypothetical protein
MGGIRLMTTTITYPFTTGGNYTYDSNLIEVTGGVARLKDITPADATCAGLYTSSIDLTWGDGTLTGTGTGTPAITSGQLDLTAASNQYVDYDATNNADSQQVGCMRATITPNYSGTPTNHQCFFSTFKADGDDDNEIMVYQVNGSGNIRVRIQDENSNQIMLVSLGVWNPTAGTAYVFEVNWDLTTGATRLFIDGTQFGTTQTATGTRSSDIGVLRIGQSSTGSYGQSDFKLDNFVYFSTVQHTTDHAGELPFATPEKYSTSNPTITTNTFETNELSNFTATESITGSDAVKYILNVEGQDRYVTGGSATNSDGSYSQSSTAAEMLSDIGDVVTARSTVYLTTFLHSDDGTTTPEVDLVTISYEAALEDPATPTLVNVEGFIYACDGPLSGEIVKIRPYESGYFNQGIFLKYAWRTIATTDANGWFSGNMYVQGANKFWEMKVGSQRYKVAIPDQAEVNIKDATTFELIEE